MSSFLGECIGTALLIIMGNGVVANVVLNKTKGNNSGWIVITFGWAMAVFLGVYSSVKLGGSGHLNPAVTLALSLFGDFDKTLVPVYIAAQFAGAIAGSMVVWLAYKQHFLYFFPLPHGQGSLRPILLLPEIAFRSFVEWKSRTTSGFNLG